MTLSFSSVASCRVTNQSGRRANILRGSSGIFFARQLADGAGDGGERSSSRPPCETSGPLDLLEVKRDRGKKASAQSQVRSLPSVR